LIHILAPALQFRARTATQTKERAMAEPLFYRIVVPTDFSECSEEAWRVARRVAAGGGELILTHILTEAPLYRETLTTDVRQVYEGARRWAQAALEDWVAKARTEGLNARAVLRSGVAYREIVALATDERADLIVVGTRGRGGMDRALLGSVADRVIRLAPCPVLTVRLPT
jgi:nucleotide-binding universal stress UspA family protein